MSKQPGSLRRAKVVGVGVTLAVVIALAVLIGTNLSNSEEPHGRSAGSMALRGSTPRFEFLSTKNSNYCSLDQDTVMSYPDDHRLQGACCDPMDMDKYRHQVEALRRYASIPEVPKDPYDVSAGLAKQLLEYDTTITLNNSEQATYNSAMQMTEEGGPCCCQCWRWYMTEGLAKFLITRHGMSASEVAEITELTNGCGGPLGATPTPSDMGTPS